MHHGTGLNLKNHIAIGHSTLLEGKDNMPQELQQRDWSSQKRERGLLLLCPPTSFDILPLLLQLVQQGLGVVATILQTLLPLLIVLLLLLCEQVPMPQAHARPAP